MLQGSEKSNIPTSPLLSSRGQEDRQAPSVSLPQSIQAFHLTGHSKAAACLRRSHACCQPANLRFTSASDHRRRQLAPAKCPLTPTCGPWLRAYARSHVQEIDDFLKFWLKSRLLFTQHLNLCKFPYFPNSKTPSKTIADGISKCLSFILS